MSKQDYNGWNNKQTWNINLMYQEIFECISNEDHYRSLDDLAGAFEAIVSEWEFNDLREGSLAFQAVGEYLDQVDWEELAEQYSDSEEDEEDEDHHPKGLKQLLAEAELE